MDKYYHVKTREDYDALMVEMEARGLRWDDGDLPTEHDAWPTYGVNTVVRVGYTLTFSNVRYFQRAWGADIETYVAKPTMYQKFGYDVNHIADSETYIKDGVSLLTVDPRGGTLKIKVNNFVPGVTDTLTGKVIRDHYGESELPTSIKILQYINENPSPAVREIADGVGLRSTNGVHGHLVRLSEKGFITFDSQKARTWEITPEGRKELDSYVSTPYATT